jgi:hypothetical protein
MRGILSITCCGKGRFTFQPLTQNRMRHRVWGIMGGYPNYFFPSRLCNMLIMLASHPHGGILPAADRSFARNPFCTCTANTEPSEAIPSKAAECFPSRWMRRRCLDSHPCQEGDSVRTKPEDLPPDAGHECQVRISTDSILIGRRQLGPCLGAGKSP